MDTKMYIFNLDYGNRIEEREFIKAILNEFDADSLVGCGIFVNNNPYNLQFFLYVSLINEIERFEAFVKNHPSGKKQIYNYFLEDMIAAFFRCGYNTCTFLDASEVDLLITPEGNDIFLFPCKSILAQKWGDTMSIANQPKIFLSHSSKDKKIIDRIFAEFQKSEIRAWYDKYEIEPGDSITEKINEGLDSSNLGIICISNSFLNSSSGWTTGELNYFIQRRMRNPEKKFIIVNLDVSHDDLPPLVQDYKYIDFKENDAVETLIKTVKNKLHQFPYKH